MADLRHEQPRFAKLVEGLLEEGQIETGEAGADDVRLEQVFLGAVVVVRDEDGNEFESYVMHWETKRAYVQLGVLEALVGQQRAETVEPDDED